MMKQQLASVEQCHPGDGFSSKITDFTFKMKIVTYMISRRTRLHQTGEIHDAPR